MKKILFCILLVFTILWSGFSQIKKEVKIGKQVWMTQNLNVDRFRNGDTIPEAKTNEEWIEAHYNEKPAWCYYNDDPANGVKYGKLYNWYAVVDPRGIAPAGWHVPSDIEFQNLKEFLGVFESGIKKIFNPKDWTKFYCDGCTNSSGLTLLPSGMRYHRGEYSGIGFRGEWWSSTKHSEMHSYTRVLDDSFSFTSLDGDIRGGRSIRCVKD